MQRSVEGSATRRFRVVVAGGGVAAVEGALALRELAADRISLTFATPSDAFVYRPLAVLRPFQARPSYRLDMATIARDVDAELVRNAAAAVDADRRELVLEDGSRLPYDALLIAIGARAEAELGGGTLTPWDWGEGHAFRSLLADLVHAREGRVVFIVPPGLTWPLPLYELALLTSADLRDRGIGTIALTIVTAETVPLEDFGPPVSRAVTALLEARGISVQAGRETRAVEAGVVRTSRGPIGADATVALPVLRARPLKGVPTNEAGFVSIDEYCRVPGARDVFAAGDCTTVSIKQGGMAARQADVAAAGIAAAAGAAGDLRPFRPVLEAVLLTGDTPLHLDGTGARPIEDVDAPSDRQRREKLFARHLTSYLAAATPPLPYFAPG